MSNGYIEPVYHATSPHRFLHGGIYPLLTERVLYPNIGQRFEDRHREATLRSSGL
jgi:hypothetical protein